MYFFSKLVIVLFTLSSCSELKMISIGKPSGIKVQNMSSEKINLSVGIPIKNPNKIGFKIVKVDL